MLDKKKIRKLYLDGYNARQIANILNNKTDTVRKCIQRNFEDLKDIHKRAVITRKEALKAINYESKRYMSDEAFVLKNRSIYETLDNGDIVLKKEARKIVTNDTPRRLKNKLIE